LHVIYSGVKLPNGIPVNSNLTIYMYIGPNSANYYQQYYPYVGQAPQLSPIYGQYDNGNYVFLFYDNFKGTSLNTSKWVTYKLGPNDTIMVNNGLTIGSYKYGVGIFTLWDFPSDTIFDAYIYTFTVEGRSSCPYLCDNNHGIGVHINNTPYSIGVGYLPFGYSTYDKSGYVVGRLAGDSSFSFFYIYSTTHSVVSIYWNATNRVGMGLNYRIYDLRYLDRMIRYNYYVIGNYGGSFTEKNVTSIWYWTRVRFMPPNGVMPRIYIG